MKRLNGNTRWARISDPADTADRRSPCLALGAMPGDLRSKNRRGQETRAEREHGGFTVVEASVASSLTVFLAILVSSAWSNLGRPLVDAQAGCEITEQAHQAAMYLAADFSGQLGTETAGTKKKGKKKGRFIVGTSE